MNKQVILLSSHLFNEFIIAQYNKLQEAINSNIDLFLLIENEDSFVIPDYIKYYPFDVDTINNLHYEPIEETLIPGSNHFPVLQFYRDFPDYDYYWNIEYDVYFHGDWHIFFDDFKTVNSDFIASHIEYYRQRPFWYWWYTINLKTLSISQTEYIKSFNPIYRISNKALNYLHKVLCDENSGHHEVFIPTVLNNSGFSLLDYGGIGNFTPPEFKNRFYLSPPRLDDYYTGTTMRFKPGFDLDEFKQITKDNLLYHPVKGYV